MIGTCWTRDELTGQFKTLGLAPDDCIMVHAGLRSLGPVMGGPDVVIDALRDAIGPGGTLMAYTDWLWEDSWADAPLRDHAPAFDPMHSRATRDNGAFPEMLRTTPGALRSANPGASCTALGPRAAWLLDDHPLQYGYGPRSPLARLVEARGKVLMLGAPLDTMTLLHHAEHLADIPGKRIRRYQTPILENGVTAWHAIEEFDTSDPIVAGLDDDYFAKIVQDFIATGAATPAKIGDAPSLLVDAADIVAFGLRWLELKYTNEY